ncbi:MAG: hypothetical protein M1825_000547 [Sarcosagium campestre]|nr:MAG: hypothetical protein M1825_000547 [Sarcosagium campestre]
MSLSKFEHLQILHTEAGEAESIDDFGAALSSAKALAAWRQLNPRQALRTWKTRRRSDGKEFHDPHGIIYEMRETVIRLYHHPNLINIVDIVWSGNLEGDERHYAVWEHCDGGTLSRLLWHPESAEPIDIPEALCWHVLDALSKALLYLHHGQKYTFPFDRIMLQDDDWHPILVRKIVPSKIFLCKPQETELYGQVKLGGLNDACVTNYGEATDYSDEIKHHDYEPPEVVEQTHPWTTSSEIWSVGAILYHMMTGKSPESRNLDKWMARKATRAHFFIEAIPKRFTPQLRDIVYDMLSYQIEERPSAIDLIPRIAYGIEAWKTTSKAQAPHLQGQAR